MDLSYTDRSAVRPGLDSAFLFSPVPGIPAPVQSQVTASGPLSLSVPNISSASEDVALAAARDSARFAAP